MPIDPAIPPFAIPRRMQAVSRAPVWSTLRLAPGSVCDGYTYVWHLFATGVSQVGQGFDRPLGPADTNLIEQGRLSGDEAMSVEAVEWRVYGGTDADRLAVVEGGSWGWEFAQRRFEGSPLTTFDVGDFDTLPEDERINIVEALRVRDESVSGRLSYDAKPGGLPMSLPSGCVFNVNLYLRGFDLTREMFVRFVLRGTRTSTVSIA